jgi:hypothetical protein
VGTAVIVSWITPKAPGFSVVRYWSEKSTKQQWAPAKIVTYKYYNYTSGFIHHANISNLEVKFNFIYLFIFYI